MRVVVSPRPFLGEGVARQIEVPRDKSLTHRAYILAAMGRGKSRVYDPLDGDDCLATRTCIESLPGVRTVQIDDVPRTLMIESPGASAWAGAPPEAPVDAQWDCRNSGTSARLMTAVAVAMPGRRVRIVGDTSLSRRPMARLGVLLNAMGADIRLVEKEGLPVIIQGAALKGATLEIAVPSAQLLGACLLAGLRAKGRTIVELPMGARAHTERMLQALGVKLTITMTSAGRKRIEMDGPQELPGGQEWRIPGDPSSASFFWALAATTNLTITTSDVCVDEERIGSLDVMKRLGAKVTLSEAAPHGASEWVGLRIGGVRGVASPWDVGTVTVRGQSATRLAMAEGPSEGDELVLDSQTCLRALDEIPVLAVASALMRAGRTRFCGLSELRRKESDRVSGMIRLLEVVGVKASASGDDLMVQSPGGLALRRLKGGKTSTFDPDGDHRLAMAAAILAAVVGPIEIVCPNVVRISYPGFFETLSQFAEVTDPESESGTEADRGEQVALSR